MPLLGDSFHLSIALPCLWRPTVPDQTLVTVNLDWRPDSITLFPGGLCPETPWSASPTSLSYLVDSPVFLQGFTVDCIRWTCTPPFKALPGGDSCLNSCHGPILVVQWLALHLRLFILFTNGGDWALRHLTTTVRDVRTLLTTTLKKLLY